jgi:hypothetical protein
MGKGCGCYSTRAYDPGVIDKEKRNIIEGNDELK